MIKISICNKKNYIYLSITILVLCLYIVFFPYFAKILNSISPKLTTCIYKAITGKPCPLCGGTRFIAGIKYNLNNLSYFNSFFGYVIIFVFLEIIFRLFLIIFIKKMSTKVLKRIFIFDLIIHSIVFITYIVYEIIYIIIT